MTPQEALRLIEIDLATLFAFSEAGRILRQGEPDGSGGPRLYLASCAGGVRLRFGVEVAEETAARIAALVADAPVWLDPDTPFACLDTLRECLGGEPTAVGGGPIFHLPHDLAQPRAVALLSGETAAGQRWLDEQASGVWPTALADAGFRRREDFWDPWVAAQEGDEIAALAFAARRSATGAEVGVYTLAAHRGRGLAGAVTAAWSSLPSLRSRALFYSTWSDNHASRRVAAGLGLEPIGVSLSIA